MTRLKRRLPLAGGLLVVGGAAVGIARAVIPSGGVINGCYTNNNGSLRVIDAGACKSNETALAWNAQGQTGATGAAGRPEHLAPRARRAPPARTERRGQREQREQRGRRVTQAD